jgi:hypothetical protein
MTDPDIAEIARGLTKAQRDMIASGRFPKNGVSLPLWRLGLVTFDRGGRYKNLGKATVAGLAVRAHLANRSDDDA